MSLTVLEQIGVKIAARLANVAGAKVIRPLQIGKLPTIEDKTILLVQGDAFKNVELSHEGNPMVQAWDQEFAIDLFIREAESDTQPVDTRINDLLGKVIAAITQPTDWEHWDNLATLTNFESMVPFALVNGVFSGTELTITVTYRHRENDPYTAC